MGGNSRRFVGNLEALMHWMRGASARRIYCRKYGEEEGPIKLDHHTGLLIDTINVVQCMDWDGIFDGVEEMFGEGSRE